jgi:phage regulator Rha-like protein
MRHGTVKRDIEELSCSVSFRFLNFEEVQEIDGLGQADRSVGGYPQADRELPGGA